MTLRNLGPDAPIETLANGAKQSSSPYRADLLPPLALLHVSEILAGGALKYGENNWRGLSVKDCLNHAMVHLLAHQAGDKSDDHLGHATCRMMMALELQLAPEQSNGLDDVIDNANTKWPTCPVCKSGDVSLPAFQRNTYNCRSCGNVWF